MLRTLIAVLVVAGFAADALPHEAPCRIRIGSTPAVHGDRLSLASVHELDFRVILAEPAPQSLELRIFGPNGHLYQALTVPIAQEAEENGRPLAGHPVQATKARRVRGRPELRVVHAPLFPVAGTLITQHTMHGRWRVEAWPLGSEEGCRARFRLKP